MSYHDILTPNAIQKILEWLTIEHSNMAALDHFGLDVRRVPYALSSLGFGQAVEPHDVLVIGQDQFLPPTQNLNKSTGLSVKKMIDLPDDALSF